MDANAKVEQHTDALPAFDPNAHQAGAQRLGLMSSSSTALNSQVWDQAKPMVAPMVWAWYDAHKDQKVAKIGGFFQVTVSSFGIAEMVITAIFGARAQ